MVSHTRYMLTHTACYRLHAWYRLPRRSGRHGGEQLVQLRDFHLLRGFRIRQRRYGGTVRLHRLIATVCNTGSSIRAALHCMACKCVQDCVTIFSGVYPCVCVVCDVAVTLHTAGYLCIAIPYQVSVNSMLSVSQA